MSGHDDIAESLKAELLKLSNTELKAKLRQNRFRCSSSANKQELVRLCLKVLLDEISPLDGDADAAEEEAYDEQEIDREIELTEQGHITPGTRESYEKYQRRMYVWWASKTIIKRMGEFGNWVTTMK